MTGAIRNTLTVLTLVMILVFALAACRDLFYQTPGFDNPNDPGNDSFVLPDLENTAFRSMVSVPDGNFLQSEPEDGDSFEHTVSAFQIARYEVTYELWYIVLRWADENGYQIEGRGAEGSGPVGAFPGIARHRPVTRVSWLDVIAWTNAYSEMSGLTPVYYMDEEFAVPIRRTGEDTSEPYADWLADGYRLPSEGEWEYAARWRGGDNSDPGVAEFPGLSGVYWTPPNWASGATDIYTNAEVSDDVAVALTVDESQVVGTKRPNQLGVYDMSGNVWEWVWDSLHVYPIEPQIDYHGFTGSESARVIRGGCFGDSIITGTHRFLQTGKRHWRSQWVSGDYLGFRVARSN